MSTTRLARAASHPATGAACRLLLGGLFLYTAVPKLLHPAEFARLVHGYRILHPSLVNLVGITLPWVEAVSGLFLAIGILPRSSAAVIAGLLGLFIGAGFLALARGLRIKCGCFFPFLGNHQLTWWLLARDVLLLVLALQPLVWASSFLPSARRRNRLSQLPGPGRESEGGAHA